MSTVLKQQGCLFHACVRRYPCVQGSKRAHGYHVALLFMQELQRIVRSGAEPFGIAITEAVEEGA